MSGIELIEDVFDQIKDGEKVTDIKRYTFTNLNKVQIQVIAYGGTITSIKLPDRNGKVDDIVLGFENISGYLSKMNNYFGATIGRCANRIGKGEATINGIKYHFPINNGPNSLHGGLIGFDKVIWESYTEGTKLILSHLSKDLDQGYPGDLLANVTFQLTEDNEFRIDYKATTTKPTIVNLTNHSYFNLAGHGSGSKEIYKHVVQINADRVLEVDSDTLPTGNFIDVSGTSFDFRAKQVLGNVIDKVPNSEGFDHNFCLTNELNARVEHPDSGRILEVRSNQPGIQFYTGSYLPEDNSCQGKDGEIYKKKGAFCLETQQYPDAINHLNFPPVVISPGQVYEHSAVFKFSVSN